MTKLRGSGLIIAGIVLILMGWVIRWDIIDWLIDASGLLLIVVGVILGIVGLVQLLSGSRGRSRSRY